MLVWFGEVWHNCGRVIKVSNSIEGQEEFLNYLAVLDQYHIGGEKVIDSDGNHGSCKHEK